PRSGARRCPARCTRSRSISAARTSRCACGACRARNAGTSRSAGTPRSCCARWHRAKGRVRGAESTSGRHAMRACLAAGVIALAGCEPGAAPRRLKVVHVAWPGRAASDAMERELYAEPRFRAWRASADFERTTVDEADAGLRGLLRGCGTVVRADGEVIAVLRGAALPSRWLDFVRRAARHREPTRTAPAAAWLEHARSAIELGRPERALEIVERLGDRAAAEQRTALRVAAHLATGEVAAARRALDEAPPAARPAVALARVLLAERRAADAIA